MKVIKLCLSIVIFVVLLSVGSFAQRNPTGVSHKERLVKFHIHPSATDARISSFDSPHFVAYYPSIKQGKLLIFMPGTNGVPPKEPTDFFLTAIAQGYRVISLSYFNFPAGVVVCAQERQVASDPDCVEKFENNTITKIQNKAVEEKSKTIFLTRLLILGHTTDIFLWRSILVLLCTAGR